MKCPRNLLIALALTLVACREPNLPVEPVSVAPVLTSDDVEDSSATATVPIDDPYPDGTSFATGTLCNIEYLGEQAFSGDAIALSGRKMLRGWLAHAGGVAPKAIELRFADANDRVVARVPVVLGEQRDDVVAALPEYQVSADSGFNIPLDASRLPRGRWRLYLAYSTGAEAGDEPTSCDNGRLLVISGSP